MLMVAKRVTNRPRKTGRRYNDNTQLRRKAQGVCNNVTKNSSCFTRLLTVQFSTKKPHWRVTSPPLPG